MKSMLPNHEKKIINIKKQTYIVHNHLNEIQERKLTHMMCFIDRLEV